eukprot:CAMPEP_0113646994 /NCGR_PEP_ID=MMETSP0017_2-20120614/24853_1 /TAXON_ID=2856 /ORGANISM="Cylindrotheca closterium" /LENGTH=282 /DNA_ID=CAMNT_0000558979 /DNA_START=160 /DNA_END=1009 /DNA_ORIENTATION=- /assembly_acc=CAM_ASM_000147
MNTPFDEPPVATTRRSVPIVTPPSNEHPSSPPVPHDTYWSPNDKCSSGEEDSDELDIRNVSAFDEWDGDTTTVGGDRDYHHYNQRDLDDIHRVLSFDEVVYNDDGSDKDDQCQDDLMWSISLSHRCHKSLQALFLPSSSSKEEVSLTSTQVTKVISNKKQAVALPNIRKLTFSPGSDTLAGATVDCSMYTQTTDKSSDSNSSSSWNSLWCCGISQSYSDDSLEYTQRFLFASSKPAPPIPDYVMTKQDIRSSSEHLLRQLENDEDKSTSITVFEDDDSFWSL